MDIKPITDDLAVSSQISPEDVPAIAKAGFRSILCNRPDSEGAEQPEFDRIAEAARAHGLEVRFQPVLSGQVEDRDATEFGALLEALPAPVLAYCRSGTRCAILWALSQAGTQSPDDILKATSNAGYDLSALAPRLKGD